MSSVMLQTAQLLFIMQKSVIISTPVLRNEVKTIIDFKQLTNTMVVEPTLLTLVIPKPTTGHDPEPVPFISHV
jgi:hypothetical protein